MCITVINAATFNLFFLVTGPGRPGHPLRPAQPCLRPLPEAQPLVPRALHVGSGAVAAQSDVEALAELLNQGFVNLVNAVLLIGGISVVLLVLDWQLALAVLRCSRSRSRSRGGSAGRAEVAYRAHT